MQAAGGRNRHPAEGRGATPAFAALDTTLPTSSVYTLELHLIECNLAFYPSYTSHLPQQDAKCVSSTS